MEIYFALAGSTLVVGFFGSVAGFGGGIFLVPILSLLFGVDIHHAIGSTMLALVPGALIASYGYLRRGLVDFPLTLLVLCTTVPLTYVGAHLAKILDAAILKPIFAALLIILAVRMVRRRKKGGVISRALERLNRVGPVYRKVIVDASGKSYRYQASLFLVGILGIIAGTAAGLFGVGGGFLTTPMMVLAFGVPLRVAAASSLLMVGVTAGAGSVSHYLMGHVDPWLSLAGGIGLSFGGLLGPRFSVSLSETALVWVVGALLGAAAVGMAIAAWA